MIESAVNRLWDRLGDSILEAYLGHPLAFVIVFFAVGNGIIFLALWGFVVSKARVNLVDNGSFERRLPAGWGTGWLEDSPGLRDQARLNGYVLHGGARARWSTDGAAHRPGGDFSLKIAHTSERGEHVWSSLAQRIRVREGTTYELRLWVKVGAVTHRGDVWISPNGSSLHWDDPKIAIPAGPADWSEHVLRFNTGDRKDLDIRFVAEAPAELWIDDVSVHRVPRWRD